MTTRRSVRGPRDRAKIVCSHCHTRKVKCDLQNRMEGPCSNCHKYGLECRRRPSRRMAVNEKYSMRQAATPPRSRESLQPEVDIPLAPDESGVNQHRDDNISTTPSGSVHKQYLGDMMSVLDDTSAASPGYLSSTAFSKGMDQEILKITGAASSPPELLLSACADAYFECVFHRFPVLNRADLSAGRPSLALKQVICMIGTMLRHPKGPDALVESEKYYYRAKSLINTNHEQDPITVLKVLCLLATRNIVGPVVLTTDNSWHWSGRATRLLQQIGLHREAVCAGLTNSGTARRIAWSLFVQDRLLSAALGRPTSIKENDFDVRPLMEEDFETHGVQSLLFMELVKLACILGRILDLRWRPAEHAQIEHRNILESLKGWIHNLPAEARIFDQSGSRKYRRDVYEIHIMYFGTIVTYLHLLNDQDVNSVPNVVSLIASSCMTGLYHEIDYRDDINYLLGIHIWLFTVAAIPQLLYNATEGLMETESLCAEELDILVSALKQFQIKIPGAVIVLNTINRLRASRSHARTPNSTTAREPRKTIFVSEAHDLSSLRDLFPFPQSLSPRLPLLELATGDIALDMSASVDVSEDLGRIFEEFSELSPSFAVADWPQTFPQAY
ncbi:hypothetical protein PHISCL_04418 [Aspergillus sclerotialis]|uniref:Zn(2)-C6 fungal-type domain-containing protein n=1 Tax=Aspergillus sclerotialis TaxID=2070753 RepID=A0A3A3A1Q8_9EURO|nr:hypothetical protein PHISCL_04418 [Aspergillus sclerotialis]